MKVIVTHHFEKDVDKELSKEMQLKLADLQKAPSLHSINNLKKLKGYKTAYRIKMGDYRIGFIVEANMIKLSRVLNRKDIYRYFP